MANWSRDSGAAAVENIDRKLKSAVYCFGHDGKTGQRLKKDVTRKINRDQSENYSISPEPWKKN